MTDQVDQLTALLADLDALPAVVSPGEMGAFQARLAEIMNGYRKGEMFAGLPRSRTGSAVRLFMEASKRIRALCGNRKVVDPGSSVAVNFGRMKTEGSA